MEVKIPARSLVILSTQKTRNLSCLVRKIEIGSNFALKQELDPG